MFTDVVAEQVKVAKVVLRRAATETGQYYSVAVPDLKRHAGDDLNGVLAGLRALCVASEVYATPESVLIGRRMRAALADPILHFHVQVVEEAIIEMFDAGLRKNGQLQVHQVKCFTPDWVEVERALSCLESEYRCLSLDNATITFTGALPTLQ